MKRNKFSLSNYKLLSLNQGDLVPIGHFEVLPGDTVQQATSALLRASPLVAPVMHPVHARIHHWFVPYRLIHEDWEDFITGGPDGMDATVPPYFRLNGTVVAGTLVDYLGVPTGPYTNLDVSAFPFRAYALIYNEWYRDQDLVPPLTVSVASGQDNETSTGLQKVAWEKDYFTSARPFEQKGPQVTIPLATTAPVVPNPLGRPTFRTSNATVRDTQLFQGASEATMYADGLGVGADYLNWKAGLDAAGHAYTGLQANLAAATVVPINDLREAFALQRYEEARARYGSRYTEYLRYLGVRSSDARLQRPEYLGGGKQTIQFSEVLQTAEGTDPVGALKGHGIGSMRSNRYRRFFEEHGIVMSLMSIKPRTVYMQSMHRSWFRVTKEDYWQHELQHIGQQPIYNRELYAHHLAPEGIFGYQDRYDEYRRMESSVAGEFRTTLNYWHMARDFSTPPVLNSSFITANPTNRVYASSDTHQIYAMCAHSIQARRMVSKVGNSFIF